jgi:hypothetical protein
MAKIKTTEGRINNKGLAKQIVGWRDKGHDVTGARDAYEMAELANLDWRVNLAPLYTPNGTETPWRMAVKVDRDGTETPLSVVPDSNWDILDNHTFCDRALKIAANFGGTVSRAGWVAKDTKAVGQTSFKWAMIEPGARIANGCAVGDSEGIQPIVMLTSGTTYGLGYNCRMMFIRSVCQNGLINLQNTGVRTTHQTSGAFENFTLEQVAESVKAYTAERDLLLQTEVNDKSAYAWFLQHYGKTAAINQPIENQPLKLRQLWDIYQGEVDNIFAEAGINLAQAKIRGTFYGVLQALVAYNNHFGDSSSDN